VNVLLQVTTELLNPLAQHGHLNFHGTGVGAMGLVTIDQFLFLGGGERHGERSNGGAWPEPDKQQP